jgi:LemA protein
MGNSKNILVIAAVLLIVMIGGCSFNGMNSLNQGVESKWSEVENNYQRRMDLINNLVNIVKGESTFEKETLTGIIEARSKATQTQINLKDATPENLKAYQEAQSQLGSSLSRLLVVTENYPNLKANQGYRDLAASVEGTENRIKNARKDFTESVLNYNTKVTSFPANVIAKVFGFQPREYFKANPGASSAPEIKF